ncbi:MAG: hypothetical protein RMN52_01290 [Anaerolineae bacterium]|nr:hypothetical protein [Candidatus Roseilinea sp.]MDW8448613.1 hypothetical protein [Anaerolineae bacterium]
MHSVTRLLPALAIFTIIAATPHPAHAALRAQTPLFSGIWSSTECEPWPGRPFARRELTLAGADYRLDVISFADNKCTIPTLRTRYEGRFIVRGPSPRIPEAWDVEFAIRRALLTPYVLNTADFLNGAPKGSCGADKWFVGIEQDLAATGGCLLIGLNLRARPVEYDIATVQGNRLFLGQRPPDGGLLFAPERRPTAFGPPLLRSGDVVILLPPVGGDYTLAIILVAMGIALLAVGASMAARCPVRRDQSVAITTSPCTPVTVTILA